MSAALFAFGLLVGCEQDETIRTYHAPKDPPPVMTASMQTPRADASADVPSWTLPEGWKQLPGQGARFATIQISEDGKDTVLTVIPLGPESGALVPNVNRWEEQIALPRSTPEAVAKVVEPIEIDGIQAAKVDLSGPQQRTLAAIIPHGEQVWFFKLTGPLQTIEGQKANFETLVQSVRFEHRHSHAPPAPPVDEPAAAAPKWTIPEGWIKEADRPMRVATFRTSEAPDAPTIIISQFGVFGTMLDNINRWRGMVGLEPVKDPSEQPVQRITIDGNDAALFDFTGPARDGQPGQRMLLAMTTVNRTAWFFRMNGTDEQIEREHAQFEAFLGSVRF